MNYKLISFEVCPFVQRSVIALEEKGAPYEIEYIDVAAKPDWFLALSPLGKVPVLQVGDDVIFESAVISEFIDETAPGRRLHPDEALPRAHHRSWVEFTSATLVAAYKLQLAADEGTTMQQAVPVRELLARYELQLQAGPFFGGADFSLVDAAAAPLLQRLTWCEEIHADLALFGDVPEVARWRDALLERASVRRSTVPNIRDVFRDYLAGGGSPARDAPPSWLGRLTGTR